MGGGFRAGEKALPRWNTHSEREACCFCTADDHLVALPSRLSLPPPSLPPRAAARPRLSLPLLLLLLLGAVASQRRAGAIGAGAERFREQIGG